MGRNKAKASFLMVLILAAVLLVSCKKQTDEDLLVDDQDLFSSAETSEAGSKTEATMETRILEESFFLDVPDVSASESMKYRMTPSYWPFASDGSYLYFVNGLPGTEYGFLTAADKATGKLIPLCLKQGCTHSDPSCDACIELNGNMGSFVFSRVGKKLLFATANGPQTTVRSVDLTRCEYRKEGTINLDKYNENGAGYSGTMNPYGTFFGEEYCYWTIQTKTVSYREIEGGFQIPDERNFRPVAVLYDLRSREETQVFQDTYESWYMAEVQVFPDEEKVYSLVMLQKLAYEDAEESGTEEAEKSASSVGSTLVLNVWDRESRENQEIYREEIDFFPGKCVLHDGKILIEGRSTINDTEKADLYELDPDRKKLTHLRTIPMNGSIFLYFAGDSIFTFSAEGKTVSRAHLIEAHIVQYDLEGNPLNQAVSEVELPFAGGIFQFCGYDGAYLYLFTRKIDAEKSYDLFLDCVFAAVPVNGGQGVVFGE
ncbi:MAG: hypothetical protein IKS18_08935 [Lachnospiraceae bacterium]|nr:hypothetical protein [Lachnospiraceae bacterium]